MHLLAVADTISHFSSSAVDRLAHANVMFQHESSANDENESTFAYTGGMETVDKCGLRFLMAKKQYEYLLRYLPLKQRKQLKTKFAHKKIISERIVILVEFLLLM